MELKKLGAYLCVGVFSGITALGISHKMESSKWVNFQQNNGNAKFANFGGNLPAANLGTDAFINAASKSTPAVVHIKVKTAPKKQTQQGYNPFFDFFGPQLGSPQPQESSGSGVIVSADGYIITNNHVIDGADEIQVSLSDNKVYTAKMIGKDPSTDLAVIKIDEKNLPYLSWGNSDDVKVGQWVLAVGNPFDLASTVTAGIVSAKARNINIIREKAGNYAIESFIQTDAAVNPGNSGGALVDLNGNLIGINAAIATPTGTFAGYSFAIPANLAKKIVQDITDFGLVQRGYLGVNIAELTPELAKKSNYSKMEGAYVGDVVPGSAAEDAEIKSGDIITSVDHLSIKSSPELQEHIARYRPGDKIELEIYRNGNLMTKSVTLKNRENKSKLISKADIENSENVLSVLGASFEVLDTETAKKLGIEGGIVVKNVENGIIAENTDIEEGFIITRLNNKPVSNLKQFETILNQSKGNGVLIEGRYPNRNGVKYYAFGF
ncbi:MAG: Do family serine endopeptidase [Bacteroidetes bacterium]|nr:Do family serine endopeptidase [Bacteroidota bacterium]